MLNDNIKIITAIKPEPEILLTNLHLVFFLSDNCILENIKYSLEIFDYIKKESLKSKFFHKKFGKVNPEGNLIIVYHTTIDELVLN